MFAPPIGANPLAIMSKARVVHSLTSVDQSDSAFRKLIKSLNLEELKILKLRKDLISRIKMITHADEAQFREYIQEHFGMTVEPGQDGDWSVDIDEIRKRIPAWSKADHEGQYVEGRRFISYARRLLMQEIRVNINMTLIRGRREKEAEKKKAADEAERQDLLDYYGDGAGYFGC